MSTSQDVSEKFTSLDEEEGPTIWMNQPQKNLVNIAVGTDPTDPIKILRMAPDEIGQLYYKNTDEAFIPLDDSIEGPTIWMNNPEENLINVVTGADPTDPIKTVRMSPNEVKKLCIKTEFHDV